MTLKSIPIVDMNVELKASSVNLKLVLDYISTKVIIDRVWLPMDEKEEKRLKSPENDAGFPHP